MKNKKWLWISLAGLDVAITGFLFVVHIIMLAHIVGKSPEAIQDYSEQSGFFPMLVRNQSLYGWAFVMPLFVILAANIVGLIIYIRKVAVKKNTVKVSDLSEEDKEALKKELLKDLEK